MCGDGGLRVSEACCTVVYMLFCVVTTEKLRVKP